VSRELFGIVVPYMVKRLGNFAFFIPRETNQFWPPTRFELKSDSGCHENGGSQLSWIVLLKGVLLKSEIAKELGILFDILGNLFNE
jgi:hypothetical protein